MKSITEVSFRKSGKHQQSAPSALCTSEKSVTHFVRDVTFSGCSVPYRHRPLPLEFNGETEVSHFVTAIGLS